MFFSAGDYLRVFWNFSKPYISVLDQRNWFNKECLFYFQTYFSQQKLRPFSQSSSFHHFYFRKMFPELCQWPKEIKYQQSSMKKRKLSFCTRPTNIKQYAITFANGFSGRNDYSRLYKVILSNTIFNKWMVRFSDIKEILMLLDWLT